MYGQNIIKNGDIIQHSDKARLTSPTHY